MNKIIGETAVFVLAAYDLAVIAIIMGTPFWVLMMASIPVYLALSAALDHIYGYDKNTKGE